MAGQGGMKVTAINGVKVYSVSGHKSSASWIPPSKLKLLRKDEEYMRRIDLIQDMNFDTATSRIKVTQDGDYLIASGIYPPQVKVFELRDMSMKFKRHLNAEIIDFQVLGDDYSKMAFLCSDRSVCFHAKFGSYFSTRIPRMGRDLAYDRWSCDLLLAASSPEIYRLNLEQGRFLAPLCSQSPGVNVIGRSPVHGLIACGGEDGTLECFDLRQKASVGHINAVKATGNLDQEVSALRFDEIEGFLLAVGTSSGQVLIYDLRSSKPIQTKDHMYGSPIIDIKWHDSLSKSSRHIISTDSRVVRIWDPQTGGSMTSVEPPAGEINDICVVRQSGLILMALDNPHIPSYFIPALGPAPKWCSYLENLTEELEEGAQTTIYDDFKFVTREDLERLNLTNLIGTSLLRAYMHGFFIDHRLYAKAKSLAEPFAYEAYRQQRIQEKLEAERATRITIKKKLPKVNRDLAARLLAAHEKDEAVDGDVLDDQSNTRKKRKPRANLLQDERFAAMFKDEAFAVDEEAPEYRALHPNLEKKKKSLIQEHFDIVDDTDSDGERNEGSDSSLSSEEERSKVSARNRVKSDGPRSDSETKKMVSASKPKLYEVKDEIHAEAFRNKQSLAAERLKPLGERVAFMGKQGQPQTGENGGTGRFGSRQISFETRSSSKPEKNFQDRKKRSVKSLGLKKDGPRFGKTHKRRPKAR